MPWSYTQYFASSWLENLGHGRSGCILTGAGTAGPVIWYGVEDFNHDGNLDVALCGNDFGTETGNGRYDALNSLLLSGDARKFYGTNHFAKRPLYSGRCQSAGKIKRAK